MSSPRTVREDELVHASRSCSTADESPKRSTRSTKMTSNSHLEQVKGGGWCTAVAWAAAATAREHGGGAAKLQEMATQIFDRATQQRIGGSGSAIGFAVSGRSRPAGRRALLSARFFFMDSKRALSSRVVVHVRTLPQALSLRMCRGHSFFFSQKRENVSHSYRGLYMAPQSKVK